MHTHGACKQLALTNCQHPLISVPSWLYVLVVMAIFWGGTNAVNLTDGIEGLLAGAVSPGPTNTSATTSHDTEDATSTGPSEAAGRPETVRRSPAWARRTSSLAFWRTSCKPTSCITGGSTDATD